MTRAWPSFERLHHGPRRARFCVAARWGGLCAQRGNCVTVTLHFIFPGSKQNLIKAKVGARDQGKTHVDHFMAVAKYGEILCHYCEPIALLKKYVDSAKLDISQDKDVSGLIFK